MCLKEGTQEERCKGLVQLRVLNEMKQDAFQTQYLMLVFSNLKLHQVDVDSLQKWDNTTDTGMEWFQVQHGRGIWA